MRARNPVGGFEHMKTYQSSQGTPSYNSGSDIGPEYITHKLRTDTHIPISRHTRPIGSLVFTEANLDRHI